MEDENHFKKELKALLHLQTLDSKIDLLKKEKDSLISALSELGDSIRSIEKALQAQLNSQDQDIEMAKKVYDSLSHKLTTLTAERNARAGELSQKANDINGSIVSLLMERKALASQLAPRTIGQYDRVRLLRGGGALAVASMGRCLGCNTLMPTKLYSDLLQAAEMHFCPQCHRIIYVR